MNQQEFVDVISKVVLESAINSTLKVLKDPPGRSPEKKLVELSKWYSSLSNFDREMLKGVIAESAGYAVFGFLCVLDGVRAIESEDKGELKLYYERRNEKILLSSPHIPGLHELL